MAAMECNGPAHTESAPPAAEMPNPSAIKVETRRFTVGWMGRYPGFRIRGAWLEAAGFPAGTRIRIQVSPGRLVIEVDPAPPVRRCPYCRHTGNA
ncbi:MAG TPA: SymE family type I addiction module toxin [Steroidobacteraceae bacterium]|nr:SymE family type I addiction module toxin [Steroidobacteraceae bacterium]